MGTATTSPTATYRLWKRLAGRPGATVPTTHRWIPKAMTVQYVAKATTSVRATAKIEPPDFRGILDGAELVVPVSVVDRSGAEVVRAEITTWVTPAG